MMRDDCPALTRISHRLSAIHDIRTNEKPPLQRLWRQNTLRERVSLRNAVLKESKTVIALGRGSRVIHLVFGGG
jgi:hypothetical protein